MRIPCKGCIFKFGSSKDRTVCADCSDYMTFSKVKALLINYKKVNVEDDPDEIQGTLEIITCILKFMDLYKS